MVDLSQQTIKDLFYKQIIELSKNTNRGANSFSVCYNSVLVK